MKYLLILLVLAGCTWPVKPDATITERTVHVDARALQPCAQLLPLPENATFDELLATAFSNMELYADCKGKQDTSIKLLKQFSNIKEQK